MGSYDTVRFRCPNCHAPQEKQTKAGDCNLDTYSTARVPLSIAGAMLGMTLTCEQCRTEIVFETSLHHVAIVPMLKPKPEGY